MSTHHRFPSASPAQDHPVLPTTGGIIVQITSVQSRCEMRLDLHEGLETTPSQPHKFARACLSGPVLLRLGRIGDTPLLRTTTAQCEQVMKACSLHSFAQEIRPRHPSPTLAGASSPPHRLPTHHPSSGGNKDLRDLVVGNRDLGIVECFAGKAR